MVSELLQKYGSDKVGAHSYGMVYDRYFDSWPVKKVLEIGILGGASIRAWLDFWPDAHIWGVDIVDLADVPQDLRDNPRFTYVKCNVSDPKAVEELMPREKFDVVIDDGPHSAIQQSDVANFFVDNEMLADGGLYFIEDVNDLPFVSSRVPNFKVVDLRMSGRWDDVLLVYRKD